MSTYCKPAGLRWAGILLLMFIGSNVAHANVFSVGSDANCTHTTLQSAIDDVDTIGSSTINVANPAVYNDVALVMEDRSITMVGGFTHCGDAAPSSNLTTLDGTGNGGNSVIRISGNAHVTLRNFVITHGTQGNDSHGGGINFNGHGSLSISHTTISYNQCGYGGGINVGPDDITTLSIGDNVVITHNTAAHEGGGIRIEARLSSHSAVSTI